MNYFDPMLFNTLRIKELCEHCKSSQLDEEDEVVTTRRKMEDEGNISKMMKLLPKLNEENRDSMMKEYGEQIDSYVAKLENEKVHNLDARRKYYQFVRMSTQFEINRTHISHQFDTKLLPKGFMRGGLYVISGISGGGKTAMACYACACAMTGNNANLKVKKTYPIRPVVYASIEQNKENIVMRNISTISALNNPEKAVSFSDLLTDIDEEKFGDMELAFSLYSLYEKNIKIITADEIGYSPNVITLLESIEQSVNEFSVSPLVVIDQYANIEGAADFSSDKVLMAINDFARKKKLTILLLVQMSKSAIISATDKYGKIDYKKINATSLMGTASIYQQALAIIFLIPEQKTKVENGQTAHQITVKIDKARFAEHNNIIKMWYTGAWNFFIDDDEKEVKQIEENE